MPGDAQRAVEHGWSRNVPGIHIESRLLEREGKAIEAATRFALPEVRKALSEQAEFLRLLEQ